MYEITFKLSLWFLERQPQKDRPGGAFLRPFFQNSETPVLPKNSKFMSTLTELATEK